MTKITYDKAKITDIDDVMHIEETSFPADEVLSRASMLERIQVIPERFSSLEMKKVKWSAFLWAQLLINVI